MINTFIAIGSNLANPRQQVEAALSALAHLPNSQLTKISSFYRSKPLGPTDQPDYLNAVVELKTHLTAEQLLDAIQTIELNQGRLRTNQRWAARTLDLDILLYGQQTIQTKRLKIPHYDMKNRAFVLYPLAEIAADLQLPNGEKLTSVLSAVNKQGLTAWDANHQLLSPRPVSINHQTKK